MNQRIRQCRQICLRCHQQCSRDRTGCAPRLMPIVRLRYFLVFLKLSWAGSSSFRGSLLHFLKTRTACRCEQLFDSGLIVVWVSDSPRSRQCPVTISLENTTMTITPYRAYTQPLSPWAVKTAHLNGTKASKVEIQCCIDYFVKVK